MELFNKLKGFKTVIFNTLLIIAGLAEYANLVDFIAPGYSPVLISVIGLANVILRWGTDTGIFQSSK